MPIQMPYRRSGTHRMKEYLWISFHFSVWTMEPRNDTICTMLRFQLSCEMNRNALNDYSYEYPLSSQLLVTQYYLGGDGNGRSKMLSAWFGKRSAAVTRALWIRFNWNYKIFREVRRNGNSWIVWFTLEPEICFLLFYIRVSFTIIMICVWWCSGSDWFNLLVLNSFRKYMQTSRE